MKIFILPLVVFSFHLVAASDWPGAKSSRGDIYDKYEPENPEVLFTQERIVKKDRRDGFFVEKTFKDSNGEVVVLETFVYKNGRVIKMELSQSQLKASGGFEVKDGKVHLHYTKNGKTKTDSENWVENFVSSDEIGGYLIKNWEALMEGDSIKIRLPVVDRLETVGFKFFKIGERPIGGKDHILVKMKPSSFIIAALVDPLVFTIEKNGRRRILEVDGRTAPKVKKENSWKDLDAILKIHSHVYP